MSPDAACNRRSAHPCRRNLANCWLCSGRSAAALSISQRTPTGSRTMPVHSLVLSVRPVACSGAGRRSLAASCGQDHRDRDLRPRREQRGHNHSEQLSAHRSAPVQDHPRPYTPPGNPPSLSSTSVRLTLSLSRSRQALARPSRPPAPSPEWFCEPKRVTITRFASQNRGRG
jgi:hypothetical protein